MNQNSNRLEAFRALCDAYGVLEDEGYSGYEDAMEYIDGERPIERFAVVTASSEWAYVNARTETLEAAQRSAVANVSDDIFAEGPVEIVDLDTGEHYRPKWSSLVWEVR